MSGRHAAPRRRVTARGVVTAEGLRAAAQQAAARALIGLHTPGPDRSGRTVCRSCGPAYTWPCSRRARAAELLDHTDH